MVQFHLLHQENGTRLYLWGTVEGRESPLKSFKGFIRGSQSLWPLWNAEDHPSRQGERSLGRLCHRIMHGEAEKREITSKEQHKCPPLS